MVAGTAPPWAKRVPGFAFVLFFVSLIAFTYLAVYFWNAYEMELTGLFTALASGAPLLIVYVFYVARPIWAVQTPADEGTVERAIREATASSTVRAVAERTGVFRSCAAVLEVAEPRCTIGWSREPGGGPTQVPALTTLLLVARSGDRKAVARVRTTISGALAQVPPASPA